MPWKAYNPKSRSAYLINPLLRARPNLKGVFAFPPGHFYSPLLDIEHLNPEAASLPYDGAECWESVDLNAEGQRRYYEHLLSAHPPLPFPEEAAPGFRYYCKNVWLPISDAYTLSAVIREERPRRIVEVGSGFSSAVMLDTLAHSGQTAELIFIEPFPDRLQALLRGEDSGRVSLLQKPVQEVPLEVFEQLDSQDVLFIDSSHVAKVGSDVTFLLLRVLPRLKPGVLVHLHDIFYPHSYPAPWLRDGWAWNESLMLRAFLIGNNRFKIAAFNAYAGASFPEVFRERFPQFLQNHGGSIWLRKVG